MFAIFIGHFLSNRFRYVNKKWRFSYKLFNFEICSTIPAPSHSASLGLSYVQSSNIPFPSIQRQQLISWTQVFSFLTQKWLFKEQRTLTSTSCSIFIVFCIQYIMLICRLLQSVLPPSETLNCNKLYIPGPRKKINQNYHQRLMQTHLSSSRYRHL